MQAGKDVQCEKPALVEELEQVVSVVPNPMLVADVQGNVKFIL